MKRLNRSLLPVVFGVVRDIGPAQQSDINAILKRRLTDLCQPVDAIPLDWALRTLAKEGAVEFTQRGKHPKVWAISPKSEADALDAHIA